MKPLKEAVKEALKYDDLNDSLFVIQESMGVESGDNAGMFFDGGEEFYRNLSEDGEWAKLDEEDKLKILREYIDFELSLDIIDW